uniref:Uncharacterized protein n=1 Tax=Palpitomonas bilix TaxID=652834 RepID=A0A7S3CUU8_9EUKA
MEGLDGDCESEMSSSSTSGKVYVIEKKRYCMRARRRWARASRCAKLAAIIAVVLSCLFFAAVLAVGASSSVIAESLFLELANSNQPRILEVELLPTSTMVPTTNPVFRVRVRSEVENPSQFGGVVSVQQTSVRQSISSPIFLDGSIESSTVVKGSNVNTKLSERRDGGDGKSSSSRVKSENEGVSRREESANSLLFPPHSNTTFDMVVSFAVLDQGEAARVGQGCIVHNQCEVDVTSIVKGRMAEMEVAMFTTSLSFTVSLPGVYFGELEVDGIVANEVETVGSDPTQTAFFFSASARMKWRVNLATGMMPSLPFSIAVVKEGEVKSNMEVAYGWNKVMPFPASTSLSDNSVASTHLEGVFKMDGVDDISNVVVRYFEGGRVNVEAALLQAGHDSCPFSICPPAPAFASILSSVRLRSSLISNGKVTARLRSFDVKEGGNGSLNVMASIVLSNPSIVNGTIKHAQFSLFPSLSSSSARSSVVLPSSSPSSSSSSSSSSMSAFGVSDLHDIKVERGEGVYDISARIVDTTSDAFSNLISSYLNMQNASFTAVVNKPSVVKGYTFTMSIPPLASSLLSRLMLVFNAQSFLALMRGEE